MKINFKLNFFFFFNNNNKNNNNKLHSKQLYSSYYYPSPSYPPSSYPSYSNNKLQQNKNKNKEIKSIKFKFHSIQTKYFTSLTNHKQQTLQQNHSIYKHSYPQFNLQSFQHYPVIRGNILWSFIYHLPQIKLNYSSLFDGIDNFDNLNNYDNFDNFNNSNNSHDINNSNNPNNSNNSNKFLNLLSEITSKIGFIQTPDLSPIDHILSSLIGLQVLNTSHIQVRLFIQKLIPILQNQKGRMDHVDSYRDAVCGLIGMDSNYQEVRDLLNILTEIKIRSDIQNNILVSPSIFLKSIPALSFHRDPTRYGFKHFSLSHVEVQRFLLTLSPHTYTYSSNYPYYLTYLEDGPIMYLDIIHSLNLLFHSKEFFSDNLNKNYVKCVHESGHILLSFFHPLSKCFFQSAYISSNPLILSECKYYIPNDFSDKDSGWISISLGGLAAEFIVFGKVSPRGSDNDFQEIFDVISQNNSSPSMPLSHQVTFSESISSNFQQIISNIVTSVPSTPFSNYLLSYYSQIKNLSKKYSHNRNSKNNNNKERKYDEKNDRMNISNDEIEIIRKEFAVALNILQEYKSCLLKISEYLNNKMDHKITRLDIESLLQSDCSFRSNSESNRI